MNVTQKKVKKVQQHRTNPGAKRTVVKTMQAESIFNFFTPPEGTGLDTEQLAFTCLNPLLPIVSK